MKWYCELRIECKNKEVEFFLIEFLYSFKLYELLVNYWWNLLVYKIIFINWYKNIFDCIYVLLIKGWLT